MNIKEEFEKHENEYLKFSDVENKKSNRGDLHAFILLDSLIPSNSDIVSGADHDIIFLNVDEEELGKVITPEQVIELGRCGVFYSEEYNCLCMFV